MRNPLESERLILRKPTLDDAPDLQRLVNHPEIARNSLSIPYPYPEGGAVDFIENIVLPGWERGTDLVFAITLKADSTIIGIIGIEMHNRNRAEIGYWIGESFWGRGYATEAPRRIIQFGFEELTLNRIQALYFTFNLASRRVMDKANMDFEGVLRSYICKNGTYIDVGMCAILRDEWRAASP